MSKQKDQQALDVNNALATSEAMIIKYKKPIITALAVVVIAVGGFFAYLYGYAKPHEDKAQELLGIVMQKYIAQQDFEHALKGEGKTAGLLKIADEYSSTDAGNIACYQAGICYYHQGKHAEAIQYLEKYSTCGDETVSAQALFTLGNCYATTGKLDKAVDAFKDAAKATEVPALCAEYLFQAAQILESQKKNDEALALYQEIKENYPDAPLCSRQQQGNVVLDAIIDKYIQRLSK